MHATGGNAARDTDHDTSGNIADDTIAHTTTSNRTRVGGRVHPGLGRRVASPSGPRRRGNTYTPPPHMGNGKGGNEHRSDGHTSLGRQEYRPERRSRCRRGPY